MPDQSSLSKGILPNSAERTSTILVVDDEALIRAMLSDYLQGCGYKVLEASNADEAILIIEKSDVVIDLVFSDVRMPGSMDGFGLAKWVKVNRPHLPIILTSGDAKKVSAAKELCEDQPFVEKPYDLRAVVARIRTVLTQIASKGEY